MARVRVFGAQGSRAKSGLHPVLMGILVIYFLIIILFLIKNAGKVHFAGPGILPIYLVYRATQKKEEELNVFVDKVEDDELLFGYKIKHKEKDFKIDEYSYWYYSNADEKKNPDGKQFTLVFKIKSRDEIIYLVERVGGIARQDAWELLQEKPVEGEELIKVHDLEVLALTADQYSS